MTKLKSKSFAGKTDGGPISSFLSKHFLHFNAATVVEASEAYSKFLKGEGNKMLITIAGAMSTAELGIILAEMIRQDKIHAITCTGANLEEDIFNLVAHSHYFRIKDWRALSVSDELALAKEGRNRVTDTCIPEEEAMTKISRALLDLWKKASVEGKKYFPHEFLYQLLDEKIIPNEEYEIPLEDSWVVAAKEKGIPIFVPGWEDSTLGNIYASCKVNGDFENYVVKGGIEYMEELIKWYTKETKDFSEIGFFQIGGGIAGDFTICSVPCINQDLVPYSGGKYTEVPMWGYFCQISDSTTSYGSYSGAVPNEKITWGKLGGYSPKFIIESDATIVAPLMFAYILNW